MQAPDPSPYGPNGSAGSDLQAPSPATATATGTTENEEEDDIAFAAEAAANAVEEADAEQQRLDQSLLQCRICGRGVVEGRPLLRFLPMAPSLAALTTQALPQPSPSTAMFSQDICLHIFCGKTASILPSVNQPELEILTKAGLKNKHGIGAEVNGALARTRCANFVSMHGDTEEITSSSSKQEKQYYLVREFELHLAAIRSNHMGGKDQEDTSQTAATNAGAVSSSKPSAQISKTDNGCSIKGSQIQSSTQHKTPVPSTEGITCMSGNALSAGNDNSFSLAGSNGPLPNPLNTKIDTSARGNHHPGRGQNGMVTTGNSVAGFVLPTPEMMMSTQAMLGPASAAATSAPGYPTMPLGQSISQQVNYFIRPPRNNILSNPSMPGAVGQGSIPPPMGAVPLPPQLSMAHNAAMTAGSSGTNMAGAPEIKNGMPLGMNFFNEKSAKDLPKRAEAGRTIAKPQSASNKVIYLQAPPPNSQFPSGEGKVKCGCGGTYLQSGTAKGAASWRNHVTTKRHQKWMETRGAETRSYDV